MKADSSYLVACAARNGPHDLAREALPGEVPRGPCVSPATLHDRTRPVDLEFERGKCALDELRGNACGGELVPDDIIARLVAERLTASDARDGAIFDGYPRTAAQAESLPLWHCPQCGTAVPPASSEP